jgi:hypothetical protein
MIFKYRTFVRGQVSLSVYFLVRAQAATHLSLDDLQNVYIAVN